MLSSNEEKKSQIIKMPWIKIKSNCLWFDAAFLSLIGLLLSGKSHEFNYNYSPLPFIIFHAT